MFTESKAGTHENYVVMQGTIREEGKLHLQGRGVSMNREYGVSQDVPVTDEQEAYLRSLLTVFPSLAGSGRRYFPVQVRKQTPEALHFQIVGPRNNRDYGIAFDVPVGKAPSASVWYDAQWKLDREALPAKEASTAGQEKEPWVETGIEAEKPELTEAQEAVKGIINNGKMVALLATALLALKDLTGIIVEDEDIDESLKEKAASIHDALFGEEEQG
jgi:hypothetical protein